MNSLRTLHVAPALAFACAALACSAARDGAAEPSVPQAESGAAVAEAPAPPPEASAAPAIEPAEESARIAAARAFFAEYVLRSERFDPALADLYATYAKVRARRRMESGEVRELELTGGQWQDLLAKAIPLAKQAGDHSRFSKLSFSEEAEGVRVRAERYSTRKCLLDAGYSMLVVPARMGGGLQIVEENMETSAQSACGVGEGKPLGQRLSEVAGQIAPALPLQVDAETRLEAVSEDGSSLSYQYVLSVNEPLSAAAFTQVIEPQLRSQTCGEPGLRAIVKDRGTILYSYVAASGEPVASIRVESCP